MLLSDYKFLSLYLRNITAIYIFYSLFIDNSRTEKYKNFVNIQKVVLAILTIFPQNPRFINSLWLLIINNHKRSLLYYEVQYNFQYHHLLTVKRRAPLNKTRLFNTSALGIPSAHTSKFAQRKATNYAAATAGCGKNLTWKAPYSHRRDPPYIIPSKREGSASDIK